MISVVIPVYNEGAAIKESVSELRRVLVKNNISDYEVVLVNDGSNDSTATYIDEIVSVFRRSGGRLSKKFYHRWTFP
jgi:glycosyltransferase involved in cell wall biosynthesis